MPSLKVADAPISHLPLDLGGFVGRACMVGVVRVLGSKIA